MILTPNDGNKLIVFSENDNLVSLFISNSLHTFFLFSNCFSQNKIK